MIGIEDLKDSLRHQLGALIQLYEAERDAAQAAPPDHAEPAPARAGEGEVVGATADGCDDPASTELERALAIEVCLVAFDAAIRAGERAQRARDELQRAAHDAMARSSAARRAATGLRHDLQRLILACGRVLGVPAGDVANRSVDDLRLALRRAEADTRQADREALAARRHAELAIAAASAALLAAVQADPSRGNPAFDPATARAARAVAERAAEQAESSLAQCLAPAAVGARVIAFRPVSSGAPGRSA